MVLEKPMVLQAAHARDLCELAARRKLEIIMSYPWNYLPQTVRAREVLRSGVLGRVHPTPDQWLDVQFGWPIAQAVGALDIGQTIVVSDRAVLAVEAIDGTDATIERAGKLGGAGLCIVKVAKPDQDPRFDLPAIGLDTIRSAARARAGVLAFEAQQTVVLDRPELAERADELGIALVAVGADGPNEAHDRRSG